MSAAVEASRLYHGILAELEVAHIRKTEDALFDIQEQVNRALRNRNSTLADLMIHQRTEHRGGRTGSA
jgi:hypothetical protein